ncbi:hypothetical protein D3C72_1897690 [compost metagenome]
MQARPAAFQLLEFGRVHDGAELRGNELVQFGHAGVDGGGQVVRHHHRAIHDLADQFGNEILGAGVFDAGLGHLALLDDLVEQVDFGGAGSAQCGGQLCGHINLS